MFSNISRHFKSLLSLNESSHRIALAFAIGLFIAFSPTHGLHTISVFAASYVFRLNFMIMMAGNLVNNPWTIGPILILTIWVSSFVGLPPLELTVGHLTDVTMLFAELSAYIVPFMFGGLLLATAAGTLGYLLAFVTVVAYRRQQYEGCPTTRSTDSEQLLRP